jgi:hypothetical protein
LGDGTRNEGEALNEESVAALEELLRRLEADDMEEFTDDIKAMVSVQHALAWALPILRASNVVVIDAELVEDDDAILAAAQRRQEKRRRDAGLDPVTGRPTQAPLAGSKRTTDGTVPSAAGGILALIEAAAEGKVRLDPGEEPKKDGDAPA